MEEKESEVVVLRVEKEKQNKRLNRIEYLVHWEDGDITWEPKESLLDEDATENIEFIRYKIRKDMANEERDKLKRLPKSKAVILYVLLFDLLSSFKFNS